MNIQYDCIPCSLNNYLRSVNSGMIPENLQEKILRKLLDYFSKVDYKKSPPALGQELHRLIREYLQDPDPYRRIKFEYNRMMMDRYDDFRKIVDDSSDPFNTAMRLSIAGNVIDFGSHHRLDIMETIDRVLKAELAVDDSDKLKKEIASADSLLYLGDNAGEIVLDRLFLETINHANVYFSVRGAPVINDATEEDADMVGIDKFAKIITTGDDAPGVLLDTCSSEFKRIFNKADVIISKGQGNFEGLSDVSREIFFMLTVKCRFVAENLGVDEKEFVVISKSNHDEKNKEVSLSSNEVVL